MTLVAAYYRTSSVTNEDGHSRQRQQDAVAEYAQRMGYQIAATRWDIHTGDSTVIDRPGFSELLAEVQAKNISVILIENASRFARDLLHQEAGVQALSKLNIQIIPVDAPETFTEDNPSRVLIRQVLGAVSEFEKASLVSKLRAARDKKRNETRLLYVSYRKAHTCSCNLFHEIKKNKTETLRVRNGFGSSN